LEPSCPPAIKVGKYEEYAIMEEHIASIFRVEEISLAINQRASHLRNVGWLSMDYAALYPRSQYSS
jgi:hypothetical protein